MNIPSKRNALTLLIAIIAAAFIGTSLFSYFSARTSLRQEILSSSLPLLSENIYSNLQSDLSLPINISSAMSRDTFLINWIQQGELEESSIREYLSAIRIKYGFLTSFFVSGQTGNYYYYDGILKKISRDDTHDVWFYTFVDSGMDFDLDVDSDEASDGVLTVFVNYRVTDAEGNLLGVAGVGIRLDEIASDLAEKQKQYNRDIFMVDETGTIQIDSDLSRVEQVSLYDIPGVRDIAPELLSKVDGPIDMLCSKENGSALISSRYMKEIGWYVMVEQEGDDYLAPARRNLLLTILVGFITTVLLVFLTSGTINSYQRHLEMLASTDSLTGALNRRELNNRFSNAVYSIKRYDKPCSIIIIDLDDFKKINDELGHTVGDRVLTGMTRVIQKLIRPTDILARWGGDEFVILLDAGSDVALQLADRIRESIAGAEFAESAGVDRQVSVSIGVAPVYGDDSVKTAFSRADTALYESKESGKNRSSLKT